MSQSPYKGFNRDKKRRKKREEFLSQSPYKGFNSRLRINHTIETIVSIPL